MIETKSPIKNLAQKLVEKAEWVMGLEAGSVLGNSRDKDSILARSGVATVLLEEMGLSNSAVGEILGLDHSSVINAIKSYHKKEESGHWDAEDLMLELIELVKEEQQRRMK